MSEAEFALQSFVFRGADVIDGTGSGRIRADVVVTDGLISAITSPGKGLAREVVEASGMVLCPGFIDTHTHDDQLLLQPTVPHPKLTQGVCTVVTGNCGISLAPLLIREPPAPLDLLGRDVFVHDTFHGYLRALDVLQPCINVVPLVGHSTLRVRHVQDLNRAATSAEVSAMADDVSQALDAGAFGLSTGVYYPPARAASTEELLGVCAALKGRGAMLAMHLRDEGDNIDAALKEALDIGAASDANLVISHHKVVGPQNHGRTRQTLLAIDQAALKQSVCLDCYPYEASSTMLNAEKASRTAEVLITWSQAYPEHSGKSLKTVAKDWGLSLHAAAQRLMPGGAIYFSMAAEDVERVLQHPLTMIGSDGIPHDRRPHPRLWGTFPRVLGYYSRDKKLLSLETAIHKMTGLPAQRFGLIGRGIIAPGNSADLVLFDPLEVRDNASYDAPDLPSSGIHAVYVNGHLALSRGQQTNSHAGRRLVPSRTS